MGGSLARSAVFGDDDPAEPNPPQPPAASLVMMAPKGDQALAQVGMDIYTVTVPRGRPDGADASRSRTRRTRACR